jgi:hypothetical protein
MLFPFDKWVGEYAGFSIVIHAFPRAAICATQHHALKTTSAIDKLLAAACHACSGLLDTQQRGIGGDG